MSITYMSWNVQNFGRGTPAYDDAKGANSIFLSSFIAKLAQKNGVSIISIMEVMPTALPHLQSLLAALNAFASGGANDWMFDYLKGSLGALMHPRAPVNSPADLTWRSGLTSPRMEGYGIFWRNGHPDFTMLRAVSNMSEGSQAGGGYAPPAPVPTNVLALSVSGRDIVPGARPPRPTANFAPAAAAAARFPKSYFPDVSTLLGTGSIYYGATRRPAVAAILRSAAGAPADRVVPLLTYHAPSNRALAVLGTFISGMATELYVMGAVDAANRPAGARFHPRLAVASGDFNLPVSGGTNWRRAYSAYAFPFAGMSAAGLPAGGADGTPIYDYLAPIKTTVQINSMVPGGLFTGPPITSANNNDYMFSAIDNMFERNTGQTHFGVIDLMPEVQSADPIIAAGVQAYAAHMDALNAAPGTSADGGPVAAGGRVFPFFNNAPGSGDWATFLAGVKGGRFTTPRSAAVFLHHFVSDHLPMIIRFQ